MKVTVPGLILFGILGCTDGIGPVAGSLTAQASRPAVQLNNNSSATVYTFVVERETAAVMNWAPCTNPFLCPGLAPGKEATLPYSDIAGYTPGARQAVVYWWHLVPGDGPGLRPDSVRGVLLDL